jgi:GNAT superfamily N-acetyltransferase
MARLEGYERELYGGGAENMTVEIVNLRNRLQFQHCVANRIWEAWWRPKGRSAREISDGLAQIVAETDFPFALVAYRNEEYLGHILGIASDLNGRPDLSPWIAALWVDPSHRRKGIATQLLRAAEAQFLKLGRSQVYLCSIEDKRKYYTARGWLLIGSEPDEPVLDIFEKSLS